MRILREYKVASGQKVNMGKCLVSFSSRTPHLTRLTILDVLGMKEDNDQGKYLGIPSQVRRTKKRCAREMKRIGGVRGLAEGEGTERVIVDPCWNNLWRMQIPPQVISFISRRLKNILPTKDRLRQKGVQSQSVLCAKMELKTIYTFSCLIHFLATYGSPLL
ncbi:hypothetical protein LIER_34913 [Lithospermum erythrorhizon]|uniref:Uncharacterized protein n=1 Tax=Lithospermum erythrorhizon TaxID=34254 RepID=A0AAV3NH64_LITER